MKVKDCAVQIRGVSYKPTDLHSKLNDNSVTLFRANNIKDGEIIFDDVLYVDKKCVSDEQYLKKGDILICASSGSKALVGKAAQIDFNGEYTFGAFCKAVRPNKNDDAILGVFFQSHAYRRMISALSQGVNINNIRNEHIDNLELPFFTAEVKQKFINQIQIVTKSIACCQHLLQKLDTLVKSRFIEMFGDPVTNPMGWDKVPIEQICTYLKSGLSRKLSSMDIGIPVIRSTNMIGGALDVSDIKYWYIDDPQGANTNDYILQQGDVLVNFINSEAHIGKVCIFKDIGRECIYTTNIFAMRLTTMCNSIFFNEFAKTQYYAREIQKIIQPAVNQASFTTSNFKKIMIPLPPIALQNQFAAFVAQADKSKSVLQKLLEKQELLRAALMQEYFG